MAAKKSRGRKSPSSPKAKVRKSTRRTAKRKTSPVAKRVGKGVKRKTARRKTTRTVSSHGTACITGTFEGDILANGHLRIARGAKCKANVQAPNVHVDGWFNGLAVAKNTMKLGPGCHVSGTIVADKLVCAGGASFAGQCWLGRFKKAA